MSILQKRMRSSVVACTLAALMAAAVLLWLSKSRARRETWARSIPIEELVGLAKRPDADILLCLVAAERLTKAGSGKAAWPIADRAVSLLPAHESSDLADEARSIAGRLCAEYDDAARAADLLKMAGTPHTSDPSVLVGLGALAARSKNQAKAVRLFRQAAQLDARDGDAWRRLGTAYLQAKLPADAVAPLQHAVSVAPNDPEVHAALGDALGRTSQFEAALAECVEAARLAPEDPRYGSLPAVSRASSARTDQDFSAAVSMLRDALEKYPEHDNLRSMLAGLYARFGRIPEAKRTQEDYLSCNPNDLSGWLDLEAICRRMSDWPGQKEAHIRFRQIVDSEDAACEAARAVEMRPNDAHLYLKLSIALHRAGKPRQAYDALQHAAQLDPRDPQIAQMLERVQGVLQQTPNSVDSGSDGDPE